MDRNRQSGENKIKVYRVSNFVALLKADFKVVYLKNIY